LKEPLRLWVLHRSKRTRLAKFFKDQLLRLDFLHSAITASFHLPSRPAERLKSPKTGSGDDEEEEPKKKKLDPFIQGLLETLPPTKTEL